MLNSVYQGCLSSEVVPSHLPCKDTTKKLNKTSKIVKKFKKIYNSLTFKQLQSEIIYLYLVAYLVGRVLYRFFVPLGRNLVAFKGRSPFGSSGILLPLLSCVCRRYKRVKGCFYSSATR